ncbi:hypothetical protein GCM10026988_31500 [Vibrio panuliri]
MSSHIKALAQNQAKKQGKDEGYRIALLNNIIVMLNKGAFFCICIKQVFSARLVKADSHQK